VAGYILLFVKWKHVSAVTYSECQRIFSRISGESLCATAVRLAREWITSYSDLHHSMICQGSVQMQ
jgi:hypothetical protein